MDDEDKAIAEDEEAPVMHSVLSIQPSKGHCRLVC